MLDKLLKAFTGPDAGHRRAIVALVIATLLYCPMLFAGADQYGRRDWDQFTFRYETPRVALLRDHELPFWNPYVNGGTVLMAHPDSPFPSPWYLLVLAIGAPIGLRVQVVLFMAIGVLGMAALLRRWKVSPAGCFLGGVVFMMSAHFALQIAEGHLEWCVLGLMPWVMICMLRSATEYRFALVAALLLSSVLLFGSVYILAIYLPFLSWWAVLESVRRGSWRIGLAWAAAVFLMVVLSAVKLLPQFDFTNANPRARKVLTVGLSPAAFVPMFLEPRQALLYRAMRDIESSAQVDARGLGEEALQRSMPEPVAAPIFRRIRALGVADEWHEYGAYITFLGLGLAICGLIVSWRSQWPLYTAGGLAAMTIMSSGSPIDLWALFQQFPFYESLTVPSRFLAAVVLVLAVAAGYGLTWLGQLVETRSRALVVMVRFALPFVVFAELAGLGWNLWGDIFVYPAVPLETHAAFAPRYQQLNTYYPGMYSYTYPLLSSQAGLIEGYENIQVGRGAVMVEGTPRYRGEIYLESGASPLQIKSRTMSKITVEFKATGPDALVLNQNYSDGWQALVRGATGVRAQRALPSPAGLVSVMVYEGDVEAYVYYRPRNFMIGAWTSAGGWAACLGLLWWWTPTSRKREDS